MNTGLYQAYAQPVQRTVYFVQPEYLWYKGSIIYNVDIDAFKDSDGDGVGDFQGIIKKLDYLEWLGIDAIWLAPFQPSPMQDNGYDVSDYYGINPLFGDGGDFSEFMYEAEKRGIRVITDLVINHTSKEHPWFQQARRDKSSEYRDWYVWSEERPADWNKGMVFPGVQEETWTYDEKAGAYYFHRFYKFQPDLNMRNPEVRAEISRIIGYWLRMGVDGFRLDAVPFILEDPFSDLEDPEHDFGLLTDIRSLVQWRKGDAIILGEANVLPEENQKYFGDEANGMHLMFNFFANQHLFYALATTELQPLKSSLEETRDIPKVAQWAHFLRNHDELDLGRLTEEQRNKVYEAFGPNENMQLYNRGIRRRLAPMLGNRKQLEMAYSLLFSLPGTPVIRYGDEIGMGDDLSLEQREAVRTPMQWSDEKNAGFSRADSTIRPVIDSGPYAYQQVNVAAQKRDPNSLLNWTARIIRLRKENPEIGLGDWEILDVGSPDVLAIQYQGEGRSLIVLHNFSPAPKQIQLKGNFDTDEMINLLTDDEANKFKKGKRQITINGFGYQWYRIQNDE
ncbi:alpha-amylase family protein [Cesiribacter sp. SM1]|uniref:alpha-amylase family protein n=1 Tax=Cesiribacter sp. SM1 TaxID=2861196 RepID=UPI00351CEC7A